MLLSNPHTLQPAPAKYRKRTKNPLTPTGTSFATGLGAAGRMIPNSFSLASMLMPIFLSQKGRGGSEAHSTIPS